MNATRELATRRLRTGVRRHAARVGARHRLAVKSNGPAPRAPAPGWSAPQAPAFSRIRGPVGCSDTLPFPFTATVDKITIGSKDAAWPYARAKRELWGKVLA